MAVELSGEPIVAATCHCDDCQAAGQRLGALAGAVPILDDFSGTPYLLYRKDRVRVVKGSDALGAMKLRTGSGTNRMVASCCNTPMFVRFDRGPHWISVYRQRLGSGFPPIEMRVQTRFAPAGVALPDDVPRFAFAPLSFVMKLVGARIAMLFGR